MPCGPQVISMRCAVSLDRRGSMLGPRGTTALRRTHRDAATVLPSPTMRVGTVSTAVILLAAVACGSGAAPTAKLSTNPTGVYGETVARAAEAPCALNAAGLPVPAPPPQSRADTDFGHDVVFYLAHPEDETLFTPGTMEALVRANKRVFAVYLSHGEGGRLLERTADGNIKERTGVPAEEVAEVRDREIARVMKTLGIEYEHLYSAAAKVDFTAEDVEGLGRVTHACAETYERWDALLPAGLAGVLTKLVEDIRRRRPRVVVTHDPRDDDDFLDHGHHKALGALVDIAARAAADPRFPGGEVHVVEELTTIAPKQVEASLTLEVGSSMRKKLMTEHTSQFDATKFGEVGQRSRERYVVRWRASAAPPPTGTSLLGAFAAPPASK
jgi:LmbE family N-acetylglucosaminyl deacetylase